MNTSNKTAQGRQGTQSLWEMREDEQYPGVKTGKVGNDETPSPLTPRGKQEKNQRGEPVLVKKDRMLGLMYY